MDKKIYDVTLEDLKRFPVWYFPMDQTVVDELSVRPLQLEGEGGSDPRVIVSSVFSDSFGKKYLGYIYWCGNNRVNDCQPVIYVSKNQCLAFWYGIIKPSREGNDELISHLLESFPISFESEEVMSFYKTGGVLEGLYYIDDNDKVARV